jgi:hypothetical protein
VLRLCHESMRGWGDQRLLFESCKRGVRLPQKAQAPVLRPWSHGDDQKLKVASSPSSSHIEAQKKDNVIELKEQGRCPLIPCWSDYCCQSHRVRSTRPIHSRSKTHRPPSSSGRCTLFQETRHFPPLFRLCTRPKEAFHQFVHALDQPR